MPLKNVHACLVHESRECVVDLVQNLHHLDPDSVILLYNGGPDPDLCQHFPFERYNAVVHPSPRRMKWGYLHDFALDSIAFADKVLGFDALTIVDSDQLAMRPGYSAYLSSFLSEHPKAGLLVGPPEAQAAGARPPPPALAAQKEIERWRPFLRRFEGGEQKFPRWSFWPSVVFTADAARDIARIWPDPELQGVLRRSRIWATEEVLFPTLAELLGHDLVPNPCSHQYVRYRVPYTLDEVDAALADARVHWMHPVPRRYDDPLRRHVRARFDGYKAGSPAGPRRRGLLLVSPILAEMNRVEGWLSNEEADLLIAGVSRAIEARRGREAIVEVGSYCGKATVVLGRAVLALGADARIHAIDPHDGKVGALDGTISEKGPTRERFEKNLRIAGVVDLVEVIEKRAPEVTWNAKVAFLLVDGLHDHASVSADFGQFERWIVDGGYVAFHDYADYYPGVRRFVDELLAAGAYRKVGLAGSLVLLEKLPPEPRRDEAPAREAPSSASIAPVRASPLVTAIMPTADRRRLVPHAIRRFLEQDYPDRELVIVDDGADSIEDLVPEDPRVRYQRIAGRRTVGAKRNIACDLARGEIIVHWDDDDWMATSRITCQVDGLRRDKAGICGLHRVLYYQPAAGRGWRFVYDGSRPWLGGNTLCYWKALWQRQPFADVDVGEDGRFVLAHRGSRVAALADESFIVAMIHEDNVSPKRLGHRRWRPVPVEAIQAVMGDDLEVYRALFSHGPGAEPSPPAPERA